MANVRSRPEVVETDVLVLGSGIAGLSYAIKAAGHGRVTVLTKKEDSEANTNYAQGGIAAVMDPHDSFQSHIADTLSTGAGLCDRDAVELLVRSGPERVRELIEYGVRFSYERSDPARLSLAREGGHSARRIVRADDLTGRAIERGLLDAAARAGVTIHEHYFALDLWVDGGGGKRRCVGAQAVDRETGTQALVAARVTYLATGGCGQVYRFTTNPRIATGDGIAMAFRAGAPVANMEFVQFHPTALHPVEPRPFLISEAVRGEGAVLRDANGRAFMREYHPQADLAPRDVVARAIDAEMRSSGAGHVWLDCSPISADHFAERFPNILETCRSRGLDPPVDPLPVVPAAHYLCGGVRTDLDARTGVEGLLAAGEVACTGVHGANRLASNSLLEGMVFAPRIVEAVAAGREGPRATGAMAALLDPSPRSGGLIAAREVEIPSPVPESDDHGPVPETVADRRAALQMAMSAGAGVVRTDGSLHAARRMVDRVAPFGDGDVLPRLSPDAAELGNLATVARAVTTAAAARTESRGGHLRADYPATDEAQRHRIVVRQDVTPTKEQP